VKPVEIALRPSRLLAGWLLGLHAVVLALALVMPLHWGARLALMLALTASLGYHLAQHALRRLPDSVTGLKLAADGTFLIRFGCADWALVEVLGTSFVKPELTVLHLRAEGRRLVDYVVVMPDALDAEAFRTLRVWLLWGRKSPLGSLGS